MVFFNKVGKVMKSKNNNQNRPSTKSSIKESVNTPSRFIRRTQQSASNTSITPISKPRPKESNRGKDQQK